MPAKLSQKVVAERIKDNTNGEYKLVGNYDGLGIPTKIKHVTCGTIYDEQPRYLLRGQGLCPNETCKKSRENPLKYEELLIKEQPRVEKLTNGEYSLLGEYTGFRTTALFRHNKCGTVFHSSVMLVTAYKGNCPECLSERKRLSNPRTKSTKDYIDEVKCLVGDEYAVSGTYVNWKTKMCFVHKKCGNTFLMEANSFLQGRRCPKCQHIAGMIKHRKSDSEFKSDIAKKYGNEYTVLGHYTKNNVKVKVRHNKCGNEWGVLPANLLYGFGCPACSLSHGEQMIRRFLVKRHITFEPQKKFEGLVDTSNLSYDFFLPEYGVLIEYQGIQHYKPVEWFGGDKAFSKQVNHDLLKKKYASEHGYKLLCIKYTYRTQSMINKILSKHIQCNAETHHTKN